MKLIHSLCISSAVLFAALMTEGGTARAASPEEAGLSRIQPRIENGLLALNFQLASESRCFFADRDAIVSELAHSKSGTKLYFSLEPVLSDDKSVLPQRFDISKAGKDLQSGYMISMQLKPPKQPLLLGIFICKDRNSNGSCRDKPAIKLEEIFDTYNVLKDAAKKGRVASDKVYFFKHIIVSEQGIYVPTESMNEERYRLLGQWLGAFGSSDTAAKTLQRIQEISSALKSRAFGIKQETIVVKIPQFDAAKCGQPGTQYLNLGH